MPLNSYQFFTFTPTSEVTMFPVFGRPREIWTHVQKSLALVLRWGKWVDTDQYPTANPNLRKQDTLVHSYGILDFVIGALFVLKKFNPTLNTEFIKDAFHQHDQGEGPEEHEIKTSTRRHDVLLNDKTANKDLLEYERFVRLKRGLHPEVFDYYHRAYLLQYCNKDVSVFSEEARAIVEELRLTMALEAKVFDALEKADYMLYAYEGYREHRDMTIAREVLGNHSKQLDAYTKIIPGFDQIWTLECQREMEDIVRKAEEQKVA